MLKGNRYLQIGLCITGVITVLAVLGLVLILTGCLLEVTPSEARMVALDGFRQGNVNDVKALCPGANR